MQAEVLQKVTELVVQERMSQCEKNKRHRRREKANVWSTEEMKNKPRNDREEDTEELIEWRSMSEEEMDECWTKLAEKIEEEVLDKYKVEDNKTGDRLPSGMETCTKKQEVQST